MSEKKTWGFANVWNASLLEAEQRAVVPRDHLWASELGKSTAEIVLKLRGVQPTNPPNARSMRKFEAGNVFEWIVSLILTRAGILREAQKWVAHTYSGMLKVTGKADFIAGGKPDYQKGLAELERLDLPPVFTRAGERIMKHFAENYPNGLEEMPLEIKSVGAYMFDGLEARNTSSKNHRIQLFHYLKSVPYERGHIVYICRDDLRILEVPVLNPSTVEDEYKHCISEISKYFHSGETPPLEKPVIFDEDLGKFAKNWTIPYSNYLTLLYGFKDQMAFDERYNPQVDRWNRVLGRIVEGKTMTDKNSDVIAEIKAEGFDLDAISGKLKAKKNNNESI